MLLADKQANKRYQKHNFLVRDNITVMSILIQRFSQSVAQVRVGLSTHARGQLI